MSRTHVATQLGLCVALVVAAAWIAGCQSEQPAAAPAAVEEAAGHEEMVSEEDGDAKIQEAFAVLSAADRELAMKQKTCPVSGDLLGVMGTPTKVNVKGHDVFICCPSCKEPLDENPDEYLAKLGLQPAAE